MFTQPTTHDHVCAILLENCITDSGYYREPAATVVELMHSYTEYTPDLNGLQILFRAENISLDSTPYYLTNYDAGIEIKLAESMPSVLLTGNNVNDLPICDRSMEFQELLDRFMQRPNKDNNFETCGVNVVNGVKPQTSAVLEHSPFQPFVPLQIESSQLPPFPLEALPQAAFRIMWKPSPSIVRPPSTWRQPFPSAFWRLPYSGNTRSWASWAT